jgi:hypothetical protein
MRKDDAGKLRWRLLPWAAVERVVEVLEYGAKTYSEDGWRTVPDGRRRYTDALIRHMVAYLRGEERDATSGLWHMAHVACNALFLLELK